MTGLWEGRVQKYSGGNAVSIKEASGWVTKVMARLDHSAEWAQADVYIPVNGIWSAIFLGFKANFS